MITAPIHKHYVALVEQAQRLGWDGEKAQNGSGPNLLAFWQSYVDRLKQAVAVLNRCARRVGHPPVSVDEDPISVADAVEHSLAYARGREEMLDYLLARIELQNALETQRHQRMPTVWRESLAQIIGDARQLTTHQDFMEVPKDSPTYERLQRIEQEAQNLLRIVNSAMSKDELLLQGKWELEPVTATELDQQVQAATA